MHPAAESFVYAGVLPAVVSGAALASGCAAACRYFDRSGWIVAIVSGAAGLLAALGVANWSQGLVEWRPSDSLDWLLWMPPLLAVASACVYAAREQWMLAAGTALILVLGCAWLLTPARESLGAHRWLWLAATTGGAAWLWLAGSLSQSRLPWTAPLLLSLACCGEAVLLALSWSLRLADLAIVGAGVAGSAVVIALAFRSDRVKPLVRAAVFGLVAGVSLLLAALAVYGAMENFSDTPDWAFYVPLLLPAAAFLVPRRAD